MQGLQVCTLIDIEGCVLANLKLILLLLLWAGAISGGIYQLLIYGTTPGDEARPPVTWPAATALPIQDRSPQLIMIAHPHCGCSRASLGELASIMAKFQNQIEATVLFYSPTDRDQNWIKTDIWNSAQSIPGVRAIADRDGAIAKLFNAKTSGQTLLYDRKGKLLFWGGITSSRGHSGDNFGRDSIVAALKSEKPQFTHTATFGCHLLGKAEQTQDMEKS